MLDPDGCLARSATRTQPSTEETGAVRTQQLEATDERHWQLALPKKFALHLDDRPANGCHRNDDWVAARTAKDNPDALSSAPLFDTVA
jgi:hypothetical protein